MAKSLQLQTRDALTVFLTDSVLIKGIDQGEISLPMQFPFTDNFDNNANGWVFSTTFGPPLSIVITEGVLRVTGAGVINIGLATFAGILNPANGYNVTFLISEFVGASLNYVQMFFGNQLALVNENGGNVNDEGIYTSQIAAGGFTGEDFSLQFNFDSTPANFEITSITIVEVTP